MAITVMIMALLKCLNNNVLFQIKNVPNNLLLVARFFVLATLLQKANGIISS